MQERFRVQGVRTTLLWLYARGLPLISGKPLLRYSRITPQIFVGPQFNMAGKHVLERAGIEYDVNMRIEYDDAAHGLALAHYCHLPTIDDDAPSMAHLHEGIAFIRDAVAAGGKVYIHCAGGIGRAPTMATAYFLSTGMSLDESVALIKRSRPFINIMPPQWEQLRALEKHFSKTHLA